MPWHKSYTHDGDHSLCHGTSSIPRWSLHLFHLCQLVPKSGSTRPWNGLGPSNFRTSEEKWKICKKKIRVSTSVSPRFEQYKTQGNTSNLVQSHFGSPPSKWLESGIAPLVPRGFNPACWGLNQPPPSLLGPWWQSLVHGNGVFYTEAVQWEYWSVDQKFELFRISDFLRIIRIIRIDKISNSIFWKFCKSPNFHLIASFQNFWEIHRQVVYTWEIKQRNHQDSNIKSCKHESPIKPLDDASSICETRYNWMVLEFLMIILTNFCDGTTFHHLWDHKILFKRDNWILYVSEVRFRNRSRIGNKLYIYTQSIWCLIC